MKPAIITTKLYASPCGELLLGSSNGRLCLCDWTAEPHHGKVMRRLNATIAEGDSEVISEAARQLDEYFEGLRRAFDVPLTLIGTDFQQAVWRELMRIPYASTIAYADLARRCGSEKAVRAVANANGANAMSIIVPCHRVVGSNGSTGGYGGGIATKLWLIDHEMRSI